MTTATTIQTSPRNTTTFTDVGAGIVLTECLDDVIVRQHHAPREAARVLFGALRRAGNPVVPTKVAAIGTRPMFNEAHDLLYKFDANGVASVEVVRPYGDDIRPGFHFAA